MWTPIGSWLLFCLWQEVKYLTGLWKTSQRFLSKSKQSKMMRIKNLAWIHQLSTTANAEEILNCQSSQILHTRCEGTASCFYPRAAKCLEVMLFDPWCHTNRQFRKEWTNSGQSSITTPSVRRPKWSQGYHMWSCGLIYHCWRIILTGLWSTVKWIQFQTYALTDLCKPNHPGWEGGSTSWYVAFSPRNIYSILFQLSFF